MVPATAADYGYLDLRGIDAIQVSRGHRDVIWAYEEEDAGD